MGTKDESKEVGRISYGIYEPLFIMLKNKENENSKIVPKKSVQYSHFLQK
jgi:hypothetical protein